MPLPAAELHTRLNDIWFALEGFEDRSNGRFTAKYFVDGILAKHYQCWLVEGDNKLMAVALTQVQQDELNTVTMTHCAGEDAKAWVFLIEQFKAWARERGSKRVEAICRPGWERLLKPAGFAKTHVVLEADV